MDRNLVIMMSLVLFAVTGLVVLAFGNSSLTDFKNNASGIKTDACDEQRKKVLRQPDSDRLRNSMSEDCSKNFDEISNKISVINSLNADSDEGGKFEGN